MALDAGSFVLGAVAGIAAGFVIAAEVEKRGGVRQLVPARTGGRSTPRLRDESKYVTSVGSAQKFLDHALKLGRQHGVDRVKSLMRGERIEKNGLVTKGGTVIGYWSGFVPKKLPWSFDADGDV